MSKHLVIVESAGKIKKISEYLGPEYIVKASFGHCMELDPKNLAIDVDNNFEASYIIAEGKHKIVNELISISKTVKSVILATDNDREGETIAWSLSNLLGLKDPNRIIFTEITKKAILKAINNSTKININIVHAQQTRRLLDRLVGYKISPILQKKLNDKNAKSAGRVQSVVVKIINDKEDEIKLCNTNLFLKTSCELIFKKNKVNTILTFNNKMHKFESEEKCLNLLNLINKKSVFKVLNVSNNKIVRNGSPPFITSTLQQEASTKLKYNIKKTMDIAQKLYESGLITYMRTDSPNLSQDAINECKEYIIDKYGLTFSRPQNYSSSDSAQDAHEAIRPTNIKLLELNITNCEEQKLYNLIWKRTIASQMTSAEINNQLIVIDTFNDDKSILDKLKWTTTYETIIFLGFLVLYENINYSETDEEYQINSVKIEIKINDVLKFSKIKIVEEYQKLPLRFNEANLIKCMEKNNIGRPSTYAMILNKIIERNYVEIKNIEGETKKSKTIELNNKYKINETINSVIINKENKKLVPTELGIKVTTFLETNFNDIMYIKFTSDFETYLDKIADGKANWYNVLNIFYNKFNPAIVELNKLLSIECQDKILGIDPITKKEIFIGTGKYGSYIKILENDKFKFYCIESKNITFDDALKVISYPKTLGKLEKKNVDLLKGKFGLYIKYNNKNYSIANQIENIDLDKAIQIIELKNKDIFIIKGNEISIKNGKFGHYLEICKKNKEKYNIAIPKNINIENITKENILEIINCNYIKNI